MIHFSKIPAALRERDQWVLWKIVERGGKPTKMPIQCDGSPAKSDDPATWTSFQNAQAAFDGALHAGIGYVFAKDDPFTGIDLDGCRNPETGQFAEWAREILKRFGTYAEVSPSKTGAKIFCRGVSPFDRGRSKDIPGAERMCDKNPAIEVYDSRRFFAVTGLWIDGPKEPTDGQEALIWLKEKYFPAETTHTAPDFHSNGAIVERARKYLAKIPGAVDGSKGHNTTFHAACVLTLGFELSESDACGLLLEWNQTCQPPWSEREITRKIREASKQAGQRGYLKNVAPTNWDRVTVPTYTAPKPPAEPAKIITIADASQKFLDVLKSGHNQLISTSIPELDYALDGGLELGELVIFAARPSHGKSAIALQAIHHWTAGERGLPAAFVSEEMSNLMLGKRTIQHISNVEQVVWKNHIPRLEKDVERYRTSHAPCYVIECCGTAQTAIDEIEKLVAEKGVRCVVVDYAQLLKSEGKTRYEQVTATSIALKQLASRTKILLLVLCQMSREVDKRAGVFYPVMSDIADSSQFEKDADVIVFLCWPHKLDPEQDRERYQFFVKKNRNRMIRADNIECRFVADRQLFQSHRSPRPDPFDPNKADGSLVDDDMFL